MKLLLSILSLFVSVLVYASEVIDLDTYLKQVSTTNQDYRSANLNMAGAWERSSEGALIFSPKVFGALEHRDDKRVTSMSVFMGNQTLIDNFTVGIGKQFSFGLDTKLSLSFLKTSLIGVNTAMFGPAASSFLTNYVDSALTLELTQPLWKNAFGRSSRWTEQVGEAVAKAASLGEAFKAKGILADAESRYWKLAITKEVVRVQEQSLDRTQRIRDWNAKREKLELIDKADLLQSEAAVKSRELDLRSARDEQRSAMRGFNAARNLDSDVVAEQLVLPDVKTVESYTVPARAADREDVKAAKQALVAATANSELARDRVLPSLDLALTGSTNGRDPSLGSSLSGVTSTAHPFVIVGVKFGMPLDASVTDAVRAGYVKEMQGAELNFEKRKFDQENNWNDLVRRFEEAKERLAAAVDLEKAQLLKLDAEKKRQKEGRSTTFQVFTFEQEYLGSQLVRIQTQGLILGYLTQMKTFRGEM